MGQGAISLIQQIYIVLPHPCDHRLEAYFITECLDAWAFYPISNLDTLVSGALESFKQFDDPDLKCMLPDDYCLLRLIFYTGNLYNVLAIYYRMKDDPSSAKKFCGAAISLALSAGNTKRHSQGLCNLAWVDWSLGDYSAAQVHAKEAQRLAIISADLYREAQALDIEAICCYTLGNYMNTMSVCIRVRDLLGLVACHVES
jgi:tetratricopeptide (TPR) repeat protein